MGVKKIAVLCSGGGTNLQALIDAGQRGELGCGNISLVVASRAGIFALERAANHGITSIVIDRRDFADADALDEAICNCLTQHGIDLVVTAGFMQILGARVLKAFENRIINVHPSLIPSFCGVGFYGLRVHRAALDYGVKLSGATVHFVNDVVDGGRILLQKAVAVQPDDTPEALQRRVMEEAEWIILPQAVAMLCGEGEI